jgi:Trypsin-like peptidase domain
MTFKRLTAPLRTAALLVAIAPAFAAPVAETVLEATFKFAHPDSTATCFLMRRDASDKHVYLVTGAHVVESSKGETATLVFRRRNADGDFKRVEHPISVRTGDTPLWTKHPNQDVAVLPLATNLPVDVSPLSWDELADEASMRAASVGVGTPLAVISFPERFESDPAGFPVVRGGVVASPPLLPIANHPTFFADYTTFAGDSGGPAFVEGLHGKPLILGLVVAQSNQEDRVKTETEERVIRRPLGLGIVVRAPFIRETLDLASKKAP